MADKKIQQRVYNKETKQWEKIYTRTTADQVIEDVSRKFVTQEEKAQIAQALPKTGGNMSGSLKLAGDPSADLEAATKGYVDRTAAAAITNLTAAQVPDLDASKIKTGTIDIDRLPSGALERCVVVEDDKARFVLTPDQVQKGDTVKVVATGTMYFVVDDTKLRTEEGYEIYTAGAAASVPWSGVTNKPTEFTPEEHTHTVADITLDESHQFVSTEDRAKIEDSLPKSGGIMTGSLVLAADPTLDKEAATKKYVDDAAKAAASALIDGSPEALDTLKELSAALGNDPNFATTMAEQIGKKLNSDEVVTVAEADKVLRLNGDAKLDADITGSAASANKLTASVKINGVSFDGSADIQITQVGGKDIATVDQITQITISAAKPENKTAIWYEIID